MTQPLASSRASESTILTKALLRAAERLGLTDRELAAVLGVSPSTVSRIHRGTRPVDPETKQGELALLLVRVFRSLDGLLGGHTEKSRLWLRAYNDHVAGVPAELLQTARGLIHVAEYLDALRGQG
ncbi:MAG: DUF2384 domain-containing protein [Acidobacteriota bacterium]|jgi:transcriptional regulator with XRE-family HTH domain